MLEELIGNGYDSIYYWSNENSTNEVDFIMQIADAIVPIEAKAEENLKAKSLKSFIEKYKTKCNVRTSMTDYRKEKNLINIPLYLISNINKLI